jgi:hypothetical protein
LEDSKQVRIISSDSEGELDQLIDQLRNEMLRELRHLKTLLGGGEYRPRQSPQQHKHSSSPRNFKELARILENYGITFKLDEKIAIISKSLGDFYVNLLDGTVKLSPILCLKCSNLRSCQRTQRKLCIIDDTEGWSNFAFSKMDMLVLSKVLAIYFDLLPAHVLKQIKDRSPCLNEDTKILGLQQSIAHELTENPDRIAALNSILAQAPPIKGLNPPPRSSNFKTNNYSAILRINSPPQTKNILELKKAMNTELKRLREFINHKKA